VVHVRVLIADDNSDMRLLTKALLNADGRCVVVGEAEDGIGAVSAFHETKPDVCVLDQQMPGQTGLTAAREILTFDPRARLVLFSAFLTTDLVDSAAELGIPCVRKDQFDDLVDAVVDLTAP